jgi:hypothetical protein
LILAQLGKFLAKCTSGDDLGLRLRGEQLAAGVRFIEIIKEEKYHLCVANPPYLGTSSLSDSDYIDCNYPNSKADLYAAFIERGLQLTCPYGLSAMITMRGWMFIKNYAGIRQYLLKNKDLRAIGDLEVGAFEEISGEVVTTAMTIFSNNKPTDEISIGIKTSDLDLEGINKRSPIGKQTSLLLTEPKYNFISSHLEVIEGQPLIYWWDNDFLKRYAETPKLEEESPVRQGMATSNNTRYLRFPWEVQPSNLLVKKVTENSKTTIKSKWVPYIKGAKGTKWIEPLSNILLWENNGLSVKTYADYIFTSFTGRIYNEKFYFKPGVAYSTIGSNFSARIRRYLSVFDVSGSSVFPKNSRNTTCLMNSKLASEVLSALNPTVNFQVGDVKRLPLFPVESADEIFDRLDRAFSEHETARETSVEFRQPAPSPWNYAQEWAQQAVDRPAGKPLPEYNPVYDDPLPTDYVSYAIGVALGRFGRKSEGEDKSEVSSLKSEGSNTEILTSSNESEKNQTLNSKPQFEESKIEILNCNQNAEEKKTSYFRLHTLDFKKTSNSDSNTLPHGILYLSAYSEQDSLEHPASQVIKTVWNIHGEQIAANKPLRKWLRESFFKDVHVKMYDKRPIYFPLSSEKKNFVALINIHRWTDNTLQTLLAEHLKPELTKLEGELKDLREARKSVLKDTAPHIAGVPPVELIEQEAQTTGNKSNQNRYATVQKLGEELQNFIALVAQCAEQGAPIAKPKDTPRETDARFQMNLDDGVMINSAALWTLLEPQWKDPKKWWSELCNAKGKKDYDWSHLAARYFPKRCDRKCQQDPSLAVTHGCFWQYHPEKAYQWELRLQDEIVEDFAIDEVNSDELRQVFEIKHLDKVAELKTSEIKRRERKEKP